MSNVDDIKSQLIEELWMPTIKEGSDYLISKRKKNKEMKVFSLTSPSNFQEIGSLLEENITKRSLIVAWNSDFTKIIRLATELGESLILGPTRYEFSILDNGCDLIEHFPFHIMNLDFSSQAPSNVRGRIEKELLSIENTISLQRQTGRSFILLFTTILNGHNLDMQTVCDESDMMRLRGWPGICLEEKFIEEPITNQADKISSIECLLNKFSQKYGYSFKYKSKNYDLESNEERKIFSVGSILRII